MGGVCGSSRNYKYPPRQFRGYKVISPSDSNPYNNYISCWCWLTLIGILLWRQRRDHEILTVYQNL
ncbi:hypothetical protein ASPSYDRAFT_40290 [Aspergillus sydowii CBS 593.65]|uniref:Uncharacterized protein n=1 Tax=Aspergillus sydowii CBS 593.65 TaxID=1036612 RepID=A0A1L9TQP1_9EURO|nr:uncharacterized protein ASPSYDRAFT_40290 [Aspergillus sydowii CBS 593.65]OJJ61759.1 hypothetical protein ASPSYDRAFT_40290 [Aspergillus sydowii CBS 593.65]